MVKDEDAVYCPVCIDTALVWVTKNPAEQPVPVAGDPGYYCTACDLGIEIPYNGGEVVQQH